MKLYENLSALRKSHNYTQAQIAKKLNVTRQTVSKWEMGISEPSLDLLDKLADIYECSVDELMGRTESDNVTAEPTIQKQSSDSEANKPPFWSIYKEALFAVIVGVIITVIYIICHENLIPQPSITLFLVIECPIYVVSTIITACSDARIKTKNGIIWLLLPILLVVVAQIGLGLIIEH